MVSTWDGHRRSRGSNIRYRRGCNSRHRLDRNGMICWDGCRYRWRDGRRRRRGGGGRWDILFGDRNIR